MLKHPLLYVWLLVIGAFVAAGILPTQTERSGEGKQATAGKEVSGGASVDRNGAVDAGSQEKDCATCSEHDKADLYEQRRMAKAAESQAWISGTGLVALVVTLILNWQATKAATRAAEETARSVDVQVRIEKPLLLISGMLTHVDQHQITFDVENVGKTPAILIEWSGQIDTLPALPGEPSYPTTITLRGTVMRPNDEPMQLSLRPPEESAGYIFGEDQATAYFWGYFLYDDVFGKTRKTGFCYIGHPYTDDEGVSMNYAHGILWRRAGGKAYNYDREELQGGLT